MIALQSPYSGVTGYPLLLLQVHYSEATVPVMSPVTFIFLQCVAELGQGFSVPGARERFYYFVHG